MRLIVAGGLALLAGCHRAPATVDLPGSRLEAAAVARGLVPDPHVATPIGAWARDTDRMCIVPRTGGDTIGAAVDYGDGQACTARGTVRRRGKALRVTFGDCRFDASYDGERIAFPSVLPAPCDALCTGRASLAAMTVERLSDSVLEARTLHASDNSLLCGS